MLQSITQMLHFIHQHDILHPGQLTFNPEGSSAAACSVGQDSRDLWRWSIASLVALCTALIRSSVILPPYRFCTPEFTGKIQYYAWDVFRKLTFPSKSFISEVDLSGYKSLGGNMQLIIKQEFSTLIYIHKLQDSFRTSPHQCSL